MEDASLIKIDAAWLLEEDTPSACILEIWAIGSKSTFNCMDTHQIILKQE